MSLLIEILLQNLTIDVCFVGIFVFAKIDYPASLDSKPGDNRLNGCLPGGIHVHAHIDGFEPFQQVKIVLKPCCLFCTVAATLRNRKGGNSLLVPDSERQFPLHR